MRHDVQRDLTVYIIAHKENDTSINALQSLLRLALRSDSDGGIGQVLTDSPLDLHVMLSYLSFEASKYHVKRFQRFMWEQVSNRVVLLRLDSNDAT